MRNISLNKMPIRQITKEQVIRNSTKSKSIIDEEVYLKDKTLLSVTDAQGIITYCNKYFVETSEYEEWELAGAPHSIVRHPDMPKVIFQLIWEKIQNEGNIIAIVKNLTKSGRYYWSITDFVKIEDENGKIISYTAYRKPVPEKALEKIIPFYEMLCEIENLKGLNTSRGYIEGYLDSLQTNYVAFIQNLIMDNDSPTKRSKRKLLLIKRLFWLLFFSQEVLFNFLSNTNYLT